MHVLSILDSRQWLSSPLPKFWQSCAAHSAPLSSRGGASNSALHACGHAARTDALATQAGIVVVYRPQGAAEGPEEMPGQPRHKLRQLLEGIGISTLAVGCQKADW